MCKKTKWKKNKYESFPFCFYCGSQFAELKEVTIDHVVPKHQCKQKEISPNDKSNWVLACKRCNKNKGGKSYHNFMKQLARSKK